MSLEGNKEKALSQFAKEAILKYIKSINLEESTKLPREELLARQLGVSRITIRSALKELATAGIIFSKQGKGTFVNKEALQMKVTFSPIEDLRNVIIKSGYKVRVDTVNLKIRVAEPEEAEKLNLSLKKKLFIIERIFYANDDPAVYCIDRIPLDLFNDDIDYEDAEESIFTYIKTKLGKNITWDKVELSTVNLRDIPSLSKHFKIKENKSLLNCDIINYDEEDNPIIYSNEYIDTDYIRFNLIRQKNLY